MCRSYGNDDSHRDCCMPKSLQLRPEIRQYLVEDDLEGKPFDRMRRSLIYQRAKNVDDTLAFGTRRDVYAPHHEWACHSMFPKPPVPVDDSISELSARPNRRVWIGTPDFGTTRPYSASIFNISAMSYGAISDNAILALSTGAKMGHFYHVRPNPKLRRLSTTKSCLKGFSHPSICFIRIREKVGFPTLTKKEVAISFGILGRAILDAE